MTAVCPDCSQTCLPLAPSQHQVWLDQQSFPDSAHLNIGGSSTVFGALNIARMEQALSMVVQSNTAMRLMPTVDGRQKVVDSWPGGLIDYEDLSGQMELDKLVQQKIRQQMAEPFLLDGKTRPWRIYIWRLEEDKHALWIRFHHVVMDGYGTSALFTQWSALYNALAENAQLPEFSGISYQDYINECQSYLDSDIYRQDGEFWHQVLPCLPPEILSKKQQKQPDGQLATGIHHYELIAREQYSQLEAFAKANRVTIYHLFIAALAIYLCRTKGKKEIVLGIPVLNRKGKRYKATLGMFSVVVPLKIKLEPGQQLSGLLKDIFTALRTIYRHARYPLYHLIRDLDLLKSGRDSMFDVLLSYEPHSYNVFFGQAQLRQPRQLFATTARYPLLVNICEFHEEAPVELVLESSSDYFTKRETEQTTERILNLLLAMVEKPDTNIDRLPLMSDEERYDLLIGKHADIPSHSNPKPFITTFEHLAALNPHARALTWLSGEMDYGTFNRQANRLASTLIAQGVQPGHLLAVIAPRLPQTLIAYFAISKVGAAYMPIDPEISTQRLDKLMRHCTAPVLVVDEASLTLSASQPFKTITIDGEHSPLIDEQLPDSNPGLALDPDSLALVLFTSGSTGEPKGVMMNHSGLSKRMAWLARNLNFGPQDIALQSIQLTFDPSLIEILLPLTHGGSVALPPPEKLAPTEVAKYAEHFGATYISIVPTIMRYVCQTAEQHPNLKVKYVGCGGERLTRALAMEFIEKTGSHVYNFWGLTETSIFASAYLFDPHSSEDPVAVGEPIDDTTIYILDENLEPLPTGMIGEIYIGGSALTLGYINEPQRTAEKYLNNPFEADNKLFKSGDLGYWDNNGQLQFVSRIDAMIKVRGQRVEPSQVESALCNLSFVAGAAVKLAGDALHGWIEPQQLFDDEHLDVLQQSLIDGLQQQLPDYMIPSGFTQLETLPRQVGGKLNYKALKPDPIDQKYASVVNLEDKQPQNDLEKVLLQHFRQILKNDDLHVYSDFFKSGGNSIDALNYLSEIHKQTGHRLPLAVLLKNPNVNMLAKAIFTRHQPLQVQLSESGQGVPVYLAASGHGDALRLKPLAQKLEGLFNIRMLQPPLPEDSSAVNTIEELAEHYASLIEMQQHQRPPLLAGFSIGGISALETARKLIARGVPISGLVLIDSTYPSWLMRRTPAWRLAGYLVRKLALQELSINQRTLGSLFSDPGLNSQIAAVSHYRPQPLSYPVTLVISSGLKRWYSRFIRPWRKLLGEHLSEQHLPGFHGNLFNEEHVDKLAEVIRQAHQESK